MNEFDCEMKIEGHDTIGDSKRKGYENQIKCTVDSPAMVYNMQSGSVTGAVNGRQEIGDIEVMGVCQSKGNLRQAFLADKTKFSKVTINRFAKIEGSKEEKVIQTITLENAAFVVLKINEESSTFHAQLTYDKGEWKDYKFKIDGTLDGSPVVSSINRITNEINA